MSTSDRPGEQRRLQEFDRGQCQAIAVRYSRRCEHDSLPGVPYCPLHYHLLDD